MSVYDDKKLISIKITNEKMGYEKYFFYDFNFLKIIFEKKCHEAFQLHSN